MLPFSNIPYGAPPGYAYPIFEFGMYFLFLICLLHAAKNGMRHVSYLFGGLVFGLLLEYVNVVTNMGYIYGKFLVMFGTAPKDIPLCIGVGWGIIMYSARLFTDSLNLSLWASAALDTLLAITIDLSMDTVAYRLHMWHWNWEGTGINPLTGEWFGIPYGNFFGWLCVVFFYSSTSRLFQNLLSRNGNKSQIRPILIPFLSVILSQVFLYVTLVYIDSFLKSQFGITARDRFVFSLIALSVTVIYNLTKRKQRLSSQPVITWLVPAFFHIYFLAFLFISGFYKENVLLIVVPVTITIFSVVLHLLPVIQSRKGVIGIEERDGVMV